MNNRRPYLCAHAYAWAVMVIMCITNLSCTNDIRFVMEFPVDEQLTGCRIEQLDTMYTSYSITKQSDKYIFGLKKEEYLFCVYDDSLSFLYKMMRRGNGNGEWIAPMPTGQTLSIDGKTYAGFLERESNVLYAVSLDAPTSPSIKVEDFNRTKLYGTNNIYSIGNNQYIGTCLEKQCDVVLHDATTQTLTILQPKAMPSKLFASNPFELSQTLTTYSDKRKTLAMSYFNFPRINIISVNGTQNITLQIGKQMPQYTNQDSKELYYYFVDICSTDNKIYCLYDDPQKPYEMSILVFDWEANPIARYHVPRLVCFTVDEDSNRFIAHVEDDTHGAWFEFRMQ